jgi:hypothetical protein
VLDWVAERKGGDDLVESIRDGRYKRQKLLMSRCGLRVPCYVVEGALEGLPRGAQAAQTASFQTEIWAGASHSPVPTPYSLLRMPCSLLPPPHSPNTRNFCACLSARLRAWHHLLHHRISHPVSPFPLSVGVALRPARHLPLKLQPLCPSNRPYAASPPPTAASALPLAPAS